MNITREKVSELEQVIKVEVSESDYTERVQKQLKTYRQKATIPGFRKGMAPMALIERMYKAAVVGEEVENLLGTSLYKYIEDEKLDILGGPLSNDAKTGVVDFAKGKDFVFYYDVAEAPKLDIDWSKIDTKMYQIKVGAKDVKEQTEEIAKRYGKFETPDTVDKGDYVYGRAMELDKKGAEKESGIQAFTSFALNEMKDEEQMSLFLGKKNEDKVVFTPSKAFSNTDLQNHFHIDEAAAKKFKSDVEFTISGISRITPHPVDDDLFKTVFPGEEIKDETAFKKRLQKELEKSNEEQSRILYVNNVRKELLNQFDAPLPEVFLKRWILSRGAKDVTAEVIDSEWNDKYVPSIKYEIIDAELSKIQPLNPTHNQIVDYIKNILVKNDHATGEEDEKAKNERLEKTAQSIASDSNNTRQIIDRLYVENTYNVLKRQLKPEVEKVSYKEFGELASK